MEGPFADDLDRLSRAEAISFIARKATAGLCQFGTEGKHAFLTDIQNRCDQEGFDVLGEHDGPTLGATVVNNRATKPQGATNE